MSAPITLPISTTTSRSSLIEEWRIVLLNIILRALVVLGGIVLLGIIFVNRSDVMNSDRQVHLAVYGLAYLGLVVIAFVKQIPYTFRAGCLIFLLYAFSVVELFDAGMSSDGHIFMLASIAMTGLFFGQYVGYFVLAISMLTLSFLGWQFSQGIWAIPLEQQILNNEGGIWITSSAAMFMLSFMLVASMGYLLGKLTTTLAENVVMIDAINHSRHDLEAQVVERTNDLSQALALSEEQSREQATLLQELNQQRAVIYELSVPVIPVSDQVLVMPLIGNLDTRRLYQAREQALKRIAQSHFTHLILDVTGVPIIDSQVARGLLVIVQSCRLLGVKVLMVGVRPEVAQTMVDLGVDLSMLETHADLQTALLRRASR